ncbi:MAG: hypothetical protein ACKVX7_03615 [Planctomycetota bacterium]
MAQFFADATRRLGVSVVLGCSLCLLTAPMVTHAATAPLLFLQKVDLSGIKVNDRVLILYKSGGRKVTGMVLEITDRTIKIKADLGTVIVKIEDIGSCERARTNQELYDERAANCKTAADWVALGEYCEKELKDGQLEHAAYQKAIELEPDNEAAHTALGEVKHDGKWMDLAEAMKAQGKELHKGNWIDKEEAERLRKADKEKLANTKLNDRAALAREYAGRPWATIDPIVTPHYNIWCNSTSERAEYYADVMEALYATYDRVLQKKFFPRTMPPGKTRHDVWIHSNHQQFMDWTAMPPGVGGFFRFPPFLDVTAFHGSFGTSGNTDMVLAHEGTHQFQSMVFKNMMTSPTWLIEGMAVYFGDGTEISRNEVKINKIPRDRLVGLQAAIEDNNYCPLRNLLRLSHAEFGGFFYGHGWGIMYWCLYGDQEKPPAWKGGVGISILNDYMLRMATREATNLEEEARYFEGLLTKHTGKSIDDWEKDYKAWILQLPVRSLGEKKGSGKWVSEALSFEVTKPASYSFIKDSILTKKNAVVGFSPGSATKVRNIYSFADANWEHAEISVEMAMKRVQAFAGGIEYIQEPTATTLFGTPVIDMVFTAKWSERQESGLGQNAPAKKAEEVPTLKYRAVLYGTPDKVYLNLFEIDPELYDKELPIFEKYLENFKIIYVQSTKG